MHPSANEISPRLHLWRRVREYAVPPSMIDTATARRAVGDWAGACAAARIDVEFRIREVRDRHGTDLAALLRTDLRRLAPDLLRWHMPRVASDGRLRPRLTLTLARYGDTRLVVRTAPSRFDAPQRMSLSLWNGDGQHPHPRFRLDLHRHRWDATRSGELWKRCGAREAWPAEAELLLRDEGRRRGAFTVRLGVREYAVLELVAPDDSHAPTLRPVAESLAPHEVAALPVLPEAATRPLPDLELLRAGLITTDRLHPLVAAALASEATPAGPPAVTADPHRVECRGQVHRIALRDGVLTAVDHDPAQLRRELLLAELGGPPLPCLRVIDKVHRSPETLPAVRERLRHGDVAGALDTVEGLLGPDAVLRDGPLLQELRSAIADRVAHGVYRAGLTGGPRVVRLDRRARAPRRSFRSA